MRLKIKPASPLEAKNHPDEMAKDEEGLSLEPFFYSRTGQATACTVTITTESGREIGNFLLQVDGRTGKLGLTERLTETVKAMIDESEGKTEDAEPKKGKKKE